MPIKSNMVQVFLSTYNGEKFLRQQLDSILNQNMEIYLTIRDDGSNDRTKLILKEYQEKYNNLSVVFGENLGPAESFFELIFKYAIDAEYYAFSDQDDVWLEDKLYEAVKMLDAESNHIKMYCGDLQLVDENLKEISTRMHKNRRTGFGNALVENIATGCTVVFSKGLREKLLMGGQPKNIYMHDWWVYIVGSAFGKVIYDSNKYILYRQHGNNVVGNATSKFELMKNRLTRISDYRKNVYKNIDQFLKIYGKELNDNQCINLIVNNSLLYKIRFLFSNKIYRQNFTDTILTKAVLLFGKKEEVYESNEN